MEKLNTFGDQFDQKLTKLHDEICADMEKWGRETEALVQQGAEIQDAMDALQASKADNDAVWQAAKTCEKIGGEVERLNDKHSSFAEKSDRANNEVFLQIDRLNDAVKELRETAAQNQTAVQQEAATNLENFRVDALHRLNTLGQQTQNLFDAMSEVENTATRRVDWVIRDADQRLRPSLTRESLHTSFFSPKFNAAGAHGLQLELQIFRSDDPPREGDAVGDCAAFLWACKGSNLSYKLHIGNKSATLEKIFNGRVAYGTSRLCFIRDQLNREDNTLRVSVEILESVREVEHVISRQEDSTCELDDSSKPLEGCVLFRRHINNRLLDQVKAQVDIMRSRMTRHVEWRVEQGSMLQKCFPEGEAICSTSFNAAGVEGLQLVFYPSGYHGATNGFCSFFLYAPAGATLRCWLWAGNQRREAHHSFEEHGAYGRTNFCRFDTALDDTTNSVLLALEIEEAHQDMQAKKSHPVVQPGDRRTQAEIEGTLPAAVDSIVKLQRSSGRIASGLSDRKVLPSLWTGKSLGDLSAVSDGLHSFAELNSSGRRPARTLSRSGDTALRLGSSAGTRRCESVPYLQEPPQWSAKLKSSRFAAESC